MEVVQVQPRDSYLHHVYVPTKHTSINWSFKTKRHNVNFGVYKRYDHAPLSSSVEALIDKKHGSFNVKSAVSTKLLKQGLTEIVPIQQTNSSGTNVEGFLVATDPGNYVLVFDNTFSKNTSKLLTLSVTISETPSVGSNGLTVTDRDGQRDDTETYMLTGWLLKKRRKTMQGWAKRWFRLTYSGILSYSLSPTTETRGLVHIPMSIIVNKPKALAFHINTGNNVYYHLKALTTDEYAKWAMHFKRLRISSVETQVDHFEQWRHKRQSGHLTSIVKDKARGDVSRGLQASQLVKEKLLCLDKWIQEQQQNQMQSDWVSRLVQLKSEVDIAVKRQDQLWHVVQDTVWQADPFGLNRTLSGEDNGENTQKSNRISVDSALSENFYDAEDIKAGLAIENNQTQLIKDANTIEKDEKNKRVGAQYYREIDMSWSQQYPILPHRRRQLPSVAVGEISSALSIFRKNVGKDLSTIALPVSMNEPMSILQRACEELEYSELLDKASKLDTPMERLMYVTVFAITSYASSQYRTGRKPFNPMMNETYENIRPDKGFRFISEKVCHHPLTIAAHAESKNYMYWQCTKVKSKFWGKSMEFITEGIYHVQLTGHEDHYTYSKPSSWIRNMIAGEKYIEHAGEMKVTNHTTGEYAIVTFKEGSGGGLFGAPTKRNDIVASFYTADNDKKARRRVVGKWSGTLSEEVDLNKKQLSELWTAQMPDVEDYEAHYGFTRFCVELNEITDLEKNQLPLTDTRYRPDQRLYELGFVDEADVKKKQIEQKQRDRRHDFELKGIPWNSRWFTLQDDPYNEPGFANPESEKSQSWVFNNQYWEARKTGKWPEDMFELW